MKTEQAATERAQKLQNDRELLEIKAVMVEPKHCLMCARLLRAKDISRDGRARTYMMDNERK